MEGIALMVGIVLMLVAAIGIVFYVALVIAIPVCRVLDWFSSEDTDDQTAQRPLRRPAPWRWLLEKACLPTFARRPKDRDD